MTKTIRVSVTHEDIVEGVPCNDNLCPIALAITRRTKQAVSVGESGIVYAAAPTMDALYLLPVSARRFVQHFDDRGLVEPFSFTMKVL